MNLFNALKSFRVAFKGKFGKKCETLGSLDTHLEHHARLLKEYQEIPDFTASEFNGLQEQYAAFDKKGLAGEFNFDIEPLRYGLLNRPMPRKTATEAAMIKRGMRGTSTELQIEQQMNTVTSSDWFQQGNTAPTWADQGPVERLYAYTDELSPVRQQEQATYANGFDELKFNAIPMKWDRDAVECKCGGLGLIMTDRYPRIVHPPDGGVRAKKQIKHGILHGFADE